MIISSQDQGPIIGCTRLTYNSQDIVTLQEKISDRTIQFRENQCLLQAQSLLGGLLSTRRGSGVTPINASMKFVESRLGHL